MAATRLRAKDVARRSRAWSSRSKNVAGSDPMSYSSRNWKESLDQMVEFVRSMHEKSGLLDELASGTTLAEAEEQVLAYIKEHCPDGSRPPLAGNTVATDRAFLARDMPTFERHVHYRSVDVSSIKELVRRWYPRVYYQAPAKAGNHRALADVQESIEELRYYREAIFVPLPGPDSAAAKQIADRHQGALTGAVPTEN